MSDKSIQTQAQDKVNEAKDKIRETHERELARLADHALLAPIAEKAKIFWEELTGTPAEWHVTFHGVYMSVHMQEKMPNGDTPTLRYHVGLLAEFIDACVDGIIEFDTFERSFDSMSTDYRWGDLYGSLKVYAYHGGTCQRVRVGTKKIDEPIFEVTCG